MPTISESAKARGQTGFLHPIHEWKVTARGPGCDDAITTTVKRQALHHFRRLAKCSRDAIGRYVGATITITRDGKPFLCPTN